MNASLKTDAELAQLLGLGLDEMHRLRKRHGWPVVRLGRFQYRFTDEQIAEILAKHTQAPKSAKAATSGGVVAGQTAKSAARAGRRPS